MGPNTEHIMIPKITQINIFNPFTSKPLKNLED